ncbi:MAG: DinB family protein [Acidimicrobiales bacterium]|jgi:hypothetical protein
MAEFIDVDLRGSHFERVDLSDARMRAVDLSRAVMRGVDLVDVDIHGLVQNLKINGVDVGPLIESELDTRHPLRAKMRPTDPASFAEAWDIVERLWNGTVERARRLDPELLHESVDHEWSFIETLRHLVFATDCWVNRAILGDPTPWDPLGLPMDEMGEIPGVPSDRSARPSLDTVLELRRGRMETVGHVIEGLTIATLDADTEPVQAPGWPPPQSFPVRKCLLIILNEEWEHRLFAERDLDVLGSPTD